MRSDVLQRADCPIEAASLLFFDIETSGLRPDRGARITELALLGRDDVQFEWVREHGHLEDATLFEQLTSLLEHFAWGIVIGHNVRFDLTFTAYEADRLGIEGPDVRFLDTLGLARRLLDAADDFRLGSLLHSLGVVVTGTFHTAVIDAGATRMLFWELVKRGHLKTLGDAGLKQLSWRTF